MNSADRDEVWRLLMRRTDIGTFSATSTELRTAVDDYDSYMDVIEATLEGRMSIDLRSKLNTAQKRALIHEIMVKRNG